MLCVCAALQLTRPASCGATVLRAVREDQHSICSYVGSLYNIGFGDSTLREHYQVLRKLCKVRGCSMPD